MSNAYSVLTKAIAMCFCVLPPGHAFARSRSAGNTPNQYLVDFCVYGIAAIIIAIASLIYTHVICPIQRKGRFPLHFAAEKSHKQDVMSLLAKGIDVNSKDSKGVTPLHEAAKKADADIVLLLLQAGGDINAKNENGSTPLYWAKTFGQNDDVIAILEKHGGTR